MRVERKNRTSRNLPIPGEPGRRAMILSAPTWEESENGDAATLLVPQMMVSEKVSPQTPTENGCEQRRTPP
jgi:hypothetical protein